MMPWMASRADPEDILRPKHIEAGDLGRCEELGATLAAGLDLGIF